MEKDVRQWHLCFFEVIFGCFGYYNNCSLV